MNWSWLIGLWGGKKVRRSRRPTTIWAKPRVDPLEDRILLAWQAMLGAQLNGQYNVAGNLTEDVTGRVSALAFGQNNAGEQALFLGADGGGVFRSVVDANFVFNEPTWTAPQDFGIIDPQTGVGTGYANINCITVDPNNPKVIYAGTGHPYDSDMRGSGILASYDGGNTFEASATDRGPIRASDGLPAFFGRDISQIIVDPVSYDARLGFSTTLYAAVTSPAASAERGIWKSQSGGVWQKITGPGAIGDNAFVTDLAYVRPGQGQLTLYAGVWSDFDATLRGVWRSRNGGAWQRVAGAAAGRIVFAYDPNQAVGNRTLYVAMHDTATGNLSTVIKTPDDGDNWTTNLGAATFPTMSVSGGKHLAFGLNPLNNRLYVAGVTAGPTQGGPHTGVAEYDPAANRWQQIADGANGTLPHTDYLAFAFRNDYVYAGNDGGLWRYNTTNGNWFDLNTPPAGTTIGQTLTTHEVNSVAIKPGNNDFMLEASQDNAFGFTINAGNPNPSWNTINGGDGIGVYFDPSDPNKLYAVGQRGFVERCNSFDPANPNAGWVNIGDGGTFVGGAFPFMTVFAVNPQLSGNIIIATKRNLYESNDSGTTWPTGALGGVGPNPNVNAVITSVAFSPLAADVAHGWGNTIWATFSDGTVWQYSRIMVNPWSRIGDNRWIGKSVSKLIVDPNHPNTAYVAIENFDFPQIWRTTNNGMDWQQITGNTFDPTATPSLVVAATGLPNIGVRTLLLDPRPGQTTLYAGTDMGVYSGTFNGTGWRWVRFDDAGGTPLPFVQVTDLQITQAGFRYLVAGTYGRGVWEDLAPPPSPLTANDAPSGANNTVSTLENQDYTFSAVDFGFSDPNDNPPDNFLAVKITTLPGAGVLKDNNVAIPAGTFVSISDINIGKLVFTPATDAIGSPYTTFTFQVQDDGGTANGGVDTDPTPKTMTINVKMGTTTNVTSSLNPSYKTQLVTFTATVTPVAPATGTATGSVGFYDGVSPRVWIGNGTLTNGVVTFATSALSDGAHTITATYTGDANFAGSTSAGLNQTVNVNNTNTNLTSSLNSSTYNQAVTFTANVSPSNTSINSPRTGTVDFYDGLNPSVKIGSGTLANGVATFTTSTLSVGDHTISAAYMGDPTYYGNTSPTLTQTVNPSGASAPIHSPPTTASTRTGLTSSRRSAPLGAAVTFSASIVAASTSTHTPTGTVQFWEVNPVTGANIRLLSTTTVDTTGHVHSTISSLSRGVHRIKAVYLGDANFAGSFGLLDETIT